MNQLDHTSSDHFSSSLSRVVFLFFIITQLIFVALFLLTGSPYSVLLLLLGFFLLYKTAFSVKNTVFLLCFYIIVFPDIVKIIPEQRYIISWLYISGIIIQ